MESLLRTTNNLLERLHASFFFYILTGPDTFIKIGYYLPSAVLISVAIMFGGLRKWVDAGWVEINLENAEKGDSAAKWKTRKRPVLGVLGIMILTHIMGGVLFYAVTHFSFHAKLVRNPCCYIFIYLIAASPFKPIFVKGGLLLLSPLALRALIPAKPSSRNEGSTSEILSALNLCLASTVISITTVLNFSLAATLAVVLGLSLPLASPSQQSVVGLGKYVGYTSLAFVWVWMPVETSAAIWDWEILGVWFAPFVCMVYTPLLVQAGIACTLPA
jgi:glycosylphosphatidylinositol transamidase